MDRETDGDRERDMADAPVPQPDPGGFSALLVPVPEADFAVLDRVPPGVPGPRFGAHVTLLMPFAPRPELTEGMLGELRSFFADVVPFAFGLDEVCLFPGGSVYLAPAPSAPFRRLTHQLARRFTEYPPYGGRFDDVVPHVTVTLLDGEGPEDIQRLVSAHGAVRGQAREAELVWVSGDDVEVLAHFPFGTAAA